jgi:hypothetical protein
MPYPVYSTTFLRTGSVGRWVYTVPQGYRAVVKNVTVMAFGAPPSNTWVIVEGIYTSYFTFPATAAFKEQTLMAVARPGEQVIAELSTAGTHTTVSGFLLRDVAGAESAEGVVEWAPFEPPADFSPPSSPRA